ncbi:MAG: hypothetical protein KAT05_01760 [Spirochaetes bacterium]|nr:hypothetical protein [Spirochaetota bacterium]
MAKKQQTISERNIRLISIIEKNKEIARSFTKICMRIITMGGVVLIIYFFMKYIYLSVKELSGKKTVADILVKFLGSINVSVIISLTFGVGGVIYGYVEKRLKKKTISRLQERIDFLEKKQNPKKKSSYITNEGNTRKDDL